MLAWSAGGDTSFCQYVSLSSGLNKSKLMMEEKVSVKIIPLRPPGSVRTS